jgi:hypothetical protein
MKEPKTIYYPNRWMKNSLTRNISGGHQACGLLN